MASTFSCRTKKKQSKNSKDSPLPTNQHYPRMNYMNIRERRKRRPFGEGIHKDKNKSVTRRQRESPDPKRYYLVRKTY